MKILNDYLVIDETGFQFAAKKCYDWRNQGVTDVAEAIAEVAAAGGSLLRPVRANGDWHLMAKMYNPDNNTNGDVWVTAPVVGLFKRDGFQWARTASGSEYLLLSHFEGRLP